MAKKVMFLGMGGTIGGVASSAADNVSYKAAQLEVSSLLASIPRLREVLGDFDIGHEQVAQLDSKDLNFSDCATLSQRVAHYLGHEETGAVIITHGTDTLEETAFFLYKTLPFELLKGKPVVLTCAMRPASSQYPDGPQNILDAASVAGAAGACGLMVVCAGVIYQGDEVQKVHPYRLNAFDAGEAGPVGFVEEGRVRRLRPWPLPYAKSDRYAHALHSTKSWPRVEIVMNYVGATGATVQALCAPSENEAPVEGLIVAATGNGTMHYALQAALSVAAAQGVVVMRTTRCMQGQVVASNSESHDFLVTKHANPFKARIALMLDIAEKKAT